MDPNDKGRRKFAITLVAMGLITAGFFACEWLEGLRAVYAEFCTSLLFAAGLFSGANVLEKLRRPKKPKPLPTSPA